MKSIDVLKSQETWTPREAAIVLGIDYYRLLSAYQSGEIVARFATKTGRADANEVRRWWHEQPTEPGGWSR